MSLIATILLSLQQAMGGAGVTPAASAYFDLVGTVWFPEPQGYFDMVGTVWFPEPQSYFDRV